MKTLLIILALIAAAAVITKPADSECIAQLRGQVMGNTFLEQLAGQVAINRYTLQVEDRIFFKQIYAPDGSQLGAAAFGCVWQSK